VPSCQDCGGPTKVGFLRRSDMFKPCEMNCVLRVPRLRSRAHTRVSIQSRVSRGRTKQYGNIGTDVEHMEDGTDPAPCRTRKPFRQDGSTFPGVSMLPFVQSVPIEVRRPHQSPRSGELRADALDVIALEPSEELEKALRDRHGLLVNGADKKSVRFWFEKAFHLRCSAPSLTGRI
jgi:hypothetical protein